MTASADPVTVERGPVGRPRNAALDNLILEAVRQLLVECGYHAFSVQEVTRRCNVHVRTITRRWPTKPELVAAAIVGGDEPGADLPIVTGRLRVDLRALIGGSLQYLGDPATRAAMPALMAEMRTNAQVAARLRRRQEEFRATVQSVLEGAVDTGDAPERVLHARSLLANLITGAAFSVQFMEVDPPKKLPVDQLTDLILAAILGGGRPDP
ncbi:MAG: TetR/AcrR family transcriptional regulator [Acidimicrobiales bacterium]